MCIRDRCSRIAVPLLIGLLAALAVGASRLPGAGFALHRALQVDLADLPGQFMPAFGQAFFSLSLGMGVMLTYGSYLAPGAQASGEAAAICMMDTLCALLAAAAVLPTGVQEGDAAFFLGMEQLLGSLPFGAVLAVAGLLAILLAALTSSVGMADCVADALPRAFPWLLPAALLFAAPYAMVYTPRADYLPYLIDRILLPGSELLLLLVVWVDTIGIMKKKYNRLEKKHRARRTGFHKRAPLKWNIWRE